MIDPCIFGVLNAFQNGHRPLLIVLAGVFDFKNLKNERPGQHITGRQADLFTATCGEKK